MIVDLGNFVLILFLYDIFPLSCTIIMTTLTILHFIKVFVEMPILLYIKIFHFTFWLRSKYL